MNLCRPTHSLVDAPNGAMLQRLMSDELTFFVITVETPCGTGEFVCSAIAIEMTPLRDDYTLVWIDEVHERFPHTTPAGHQQWVAGAIEYVIDASGTFVAGQIVPEASLHLDEMPEEFIGCPDSLEAIKAALVA